MAKKITILSLLMALVASFAIAQAAPAAAPAPAAGPVVSADFSQRIDASSAGGKVANSILAYTAWPQANNCFPLFDRTELNGSATFDLGGGLKIAPWIRDRFEIGLNNDGTATNTLIDLKSFNFRNRAYLGLNTTLALDKAFNLGLNLEYRVESALNGSKTLNQVANPLTSSASSSATGAVTTRLAPALNVNGKIEGFAYTVTGAVDFNFDPSGYNNQDNSFQEIEGTGAVSYTFKLDDISSLAIGVTDYIDVNNPTVYGANLAKPILPETFNAFTPRVTLKVGGFSPFVGFLWYVNQNNYSTITQNTTTDNLVGFSAGTDLSVGSATFNFTYDFGVNQAVSKVGQIESKTSVSVKIKA